MRFSHLLTRYRTLETPDGAGGLIETPVTPLSVWGNLVINAAETKLFVDPLEDVQIEDQLAVDDDQAGPVRALVVLAGMVVVDAGGLPIVCLIERAAAWYRVVGTRVVPGTRVRELSLERMGRPIGV